ncbi:HDOD domain-containing protein [Alteromonas mediterranea]|uniref:HDOD domain-containing protein n=1 Tax=Alteromonas mediterranea TaxID=314275 RepID=UPI001132076F|nr:HDOD domain-containing protein [Alteromonas mediterranea]QDG37211.1 HDOD domain-containing protein [Alteromonas mediterranea]
MTMGATTPPTIDERFENMLISPERVLEMLGKRRVGEVSFEQSEQGDARRLLLNVEKVAIENKRLQEKTEATYQESVSHQLHEILFEELTEQLSYTDELVQSVLNLPENIGELLDALSVRACSVSKLEPIAATMPWLYDELIVVVNTPQFRRKDSRGRIIVVETLRTALSFLGIENLRTLIPSLILKRAMPQITDPYPLIKQKLTRYSTGVAMTTKRLGIINDINKNTAYTLGMLSNLGRCAVTRLYFKLFDKIQLHLLKECQKDKEQKRHEALLKITPSANHLIAMQQEFADAVSADIMEWMNLKRLPIASPMRDCANKIPAESGSLCKVLHQARSYTQVRMLHQLKLVEMKDVKPLFVEQKYPQGALEKLKTIDIFTLPLVKNEDSH